LLARRARQGKSHKLTTGTEACPRLYSRHCNFSHMNERLAEIIGMLLSDGSVYFDKSKRTYCIQFTNSVPGMLKRFVSLFQAEFGKRNYCVNKCRNAQSVRFFSKEIAIQLFSYSPSYRTMKTADGYPPCRIPEKVLRNQLLAAPFLRAFASCDGCVFGNSSHPNGVVEIACHHPFLRNQLACLLSSFSIRSSISSRRLTIQDKTSVRLFAEKIGFQNESLVCNSCSSLQGLKKNQILRSLVYPNSPNSQPNYPPDPVPYGKQYNIC
jgi:hypothetical protein